MKLVRFQEPLLQFGTSQHVDVRFGILNYCPLDFENPRAPRQIRVGVVGSAVSLEGLRDWLERCRNEIPAKESRQPNLFPRFPGFNSDCAFHSELLLDSSLERQISSEELASILKVSVPGEQKVHAARAIVEQVRSLLDKKPPDVIVVALPQELLNAFESPEEGIDLEDETANAQTPAGDRIDFHDLLKARCMSLPRACPIQIVLPATYDASKRRRGRCRNRDVRPLQDEATRAWNFHTALYYKAGGTPWKLTLDPTKPQTCFIGVGFFYTLDRQKICTSVAQVFNERGDGVVVRGEPAVYDKVDRSIHLDADASYRLLVRALDEYRHEHHTVPARVVVHKTSWHNSAEADGFLKAIDEYRIHSIELLSLSRSFTRLFRNGFYPPLRGMFLTLDEHSHILYTRGSVEFYATYPGMYMPRTLRVACDRIEQTPRYLAEEILALTKMNWNDTQFDGGLPITIRAAHEVGDLLRYTAPSDNIPPHYSFYM